MTELNAYEIARLEAEIGRLHRTLAYIVELVEGEVDVDKHGGPNLAMRVLTAAEAGLSTR